MIRYNGITKGSRKAKRDGTREIQKFKMAVFMGWMPNLENNDPYSPRTSWFDKNFDARGRRKETLFFKMTFDKIVKAKSMPHMKRTLSKLVQKKTYRQTL